jgi:hypothetical protein
MRRLINLLLFFLTLFCAVGFVHSQIPQALVNGTVSDEAGAVMPGATVTLISISTPPARYSIRTDDDGNFLFRVEPGIYRVEAEARPSPFLPNRRAPIRIESGPKNVLNLTLFAPRYFPTRYNTPIPDGLDDAATERVSFKFDELYITGDRRRPAMIRYVKKTASRQNTTYVGIVPYDKNRGSGVYLSFDWFEIYAEKIVVKRRSNLVQCIGSVLITKRGETQLKSESVTLRIRPDGLEPVNLFLSRN